MGIFINGKCRSKARLDDKTAIVTGCNTGIGKYTVMDLCRRGARVVMACRNLDKAEEAAKQIRDRLEHNQNAGKISIKHLDLSSLSSVRTCAGEILREEPCIHLLINNAGVMMCPHQLTEDGYEYQLATNHLGHFLFTLLLLPRILNSAPARVVNLSSMAHLIDTGVTVYSVHPGIVDTELDRHFDATIFSGSKAFLRSFGCLYKKTVKQGAQTTLYCALDEKTANETGLYYSDCEAAVTSPKATDPKLAKQLWDLSLQMVHWDHNTDPFKQG
ncbi:retinol dehydrogenase 12-like isoform X2 [Nilaparvata lugens]|uniref:retinol dehydrogenase 12-like isoform X2 n=1 Tax=Nilaparvata lugens TaxID=108931 RepID=UPI00193E09DD|nr:retinol dehydrogenase 12-like isoform X2 [Nilaparvata lugens]